MEKPRLSYNKEQHSAFRMSQNEPLISPLPHSIIALKLLFPMQMKPFGPHSCHKREILMFKVNELFIPLLVPELSAPDSPALAHSLYLTSHPWVTYDESFCGHQCNITVH